MFKRNQNFSLALLPAMFESGNIFGESAPENHLMNFKRQSAPLNFSDQFTAVTSNEEISWSCIATNLSFTSCGAVTTGVQLYELAQDAKNVCTKFVSNATCLTGARMGSKKIDSTLFYTQSAFSFNTMVNTNKFNNDVVRDTFNRTLTASGRPDAAISE